MARSVYDIRIGSYWRTTRGVAVVRDVQYAELTPAQRAKGRRKRSREWTVEFTDTGRTARLKKTSFVMPIGPHANPERIDKEEIAKVRLLEMVNDALKGLPGNWKAVGEHPGGKFKIVVNFPVTLYEKLTTENRTRASLDAILDLTKEKEKPIED
jgi:hypothetical protein